MTILLIKTLTTFKGIRNSIIGFCCDTTEVLTDQFVVKSRSVIFSTRRKLRHGVAFYEMLALGAHSIAKKRNLSNQNNLVALPPFPKLSVKFQRNRLPNVQDIKFFNVRPPPKFCLINLFMSSLSPAALKKSCSVTVIHLFKTAERKSKLQLLVDN